MDYHYIPVTVYKRDGRLYLAKPLYEGVDRSKPAATIKAEIVGYELKRVFLSIQPGKKPPRDAELQLWTLKQAGMMERMKEAAELLED